METRRAAVCRRGPATWTGALDHRVACELGEGGHRPGLAHEYSACSV